MSLYMTGTLQVHQPCKLCKHYFHNLHSTLSINLPTTAAVARNTSSSSIFSLILSLFWSSFLLSLFPFSLSLSLSLSIIWTEMMLPKFVCFHHLRQSSSLSLGHQDFVASSPTSWKSMQKKKNYWKNIFLSLSAFFLSFFSLFKQLERKIFK